MTETRDKVETTGIQGPFFSRQDLEVLASGSISSVFGDWFKPIDTYTRVIRMPEPPLLLVDRILGIKGEPGSMGKGSLWSETEVKANEWYIHQGRMLTGVALEAGQADLLLSSWLGFDFHNRGERVYRLLGCEVTCYGELPKPGEILHFDIHIKGHASQGDIKLFFFQYDCHVKGELRFRLRNGQAGFFSDRELAESGGVIWDAAHEKIDETLIIDKPTLLCEKNSFTQKELQQFAEGNVEQCFGEGFALTKSHVRTPRIPKGNLLFLNEITHFDSTGGPWKRGYMRAIQNISPDDWFFKCHFKNDPCMPGSLMLEAGLQVMSCYLTALGYTVDKDGWRFEPVPGYTSKLKCRGQINPQAKQVSYEIFITSVIAGPIPKVFAVLLGSVDGLKSMYTNISIQLTPDSPVVDLTPLQNESGAIESFTQQNNFNLDLTNKPIRYFNDDICLPNSKNLMLDTITGFWPQGGKRKKGRLSGIKILKLEETLPLPVVAMEQLIQFYMIHEKMHFSIYHPYFQTAPTVESLWHNQVEVTSETKKLTITIDIISEGHDGRGPYVIADGIIWIDEKLICEINNMHVQILSRGDEQEYKTYPVHSSHH